jgi:vesicle transport protein SEC22
LQSRVEEADPGIMVKLTMIARVTDGLPLAEGLDDGRDQKDLEFYKQQAKQLCKRLSQQKQGASRMSVETGPYFFHYLIEGGVCYLTLCDRSYPKKLAYQYLEELQREFEKVNRSQIETVARPYAFIKFDTFIQKTRKLYLDTRTQRNLSKLNDDLFEVQQIMTRNIQEVLGVGDRLDQVSQMSSRLSSESRIFADKAKDLNRQAFIRKWAPVAIVVGIVVLLLWFRRYFWG